MRFKLKIDIEDKREAEDIDSEQMALTKDCSSITYKVDPLRVPRNACTYNGWLENCKELKLLTDKELKVVVYVWKVAIYICIAAYFISGVL